jgi:hypothetical protein
VKNLNAVLKDSYGYDAHSTESIKEPVAKSFDLHSNF